MQITRKKLFTFLLPILIFISCSNSDHKTNLSAEKPQAENVATESSDLSADAVQDDCAQLPNNFSSYDQAIHLVRSSSFKISETVNTSRSSWVRGAEYYSCDGYTGYFIIETSNRIYIHANMPISVWRQFKNARSFGSFYDYDIKGRYRLYLNK